jgi:hypothetical protein
VGNLMLPGIKPRLSLSTSIFDTLEEACSRLAADSLAAAALTLPQIAVWDPRCALILEGGGALSTSWLVSALCPALGAASAGRWLARTASDVITSKHSSPVISPGAKDLTSRTAGL